MTCTKYIRVYFSVLFLLILSQTAIANPLKGYITGRVIDAETGEPLAGVNIMVEHTTVGAATNPAGGFQINRVPVGKFHLVASMIGYELGHEEILVRKNKETVVDFRLKSTLLEMGAVVVTGTATPHIYEETPVKTEVIPHQLIEQKFAVNLAEALSLQTGVRVENNCQNCNFTQVRIYGMEGKYSQILVDGDPVMSTLAGVYGLEYFPEEMLSQIEIVKGGGSALYGGNAIAGVINLITGRPSVNRTRIRYLNNSVSGKMDQRVGVVSELVSSDNKSGAFIFGSTRKRNPYDHNGDGFSELGELSNESIGFKYFYTPFAAGQFATQIHRIHEERRGGDSFEKPVHEAQVAEAVEHWRWGGNFNWQQRIGALFDYRLFYSFAHTKRNSFYGGLGDEPDWDADENRLANLASYGRTINPVHVSGMKANYHFANHLFTTGFEYSLEDLTDTSIENPNYHIDETYSNFGFFLQDNLHFGGDRLEFVLGARVDDHSEIENIIVSPRFNAKFNLSDNWVVRSAFSTGFKAPQVFDEDLHIQAIEGEQQVIINAENLTEEKSISISGGFEYHSQIGSMPLLFSTSGFYTRLNNAFAVEPAPTVQDPYRYIRTNTDGARVMGIEVNLATRFASGFELRSGFTIKQSKYDSKVEVIEAVHDALDESVIIQEAIFLDKFIRTPDVYGNMSLSYYLTSKLQLIGSVDYTGSADLPHAEPVNGLPYIKTTDSYIDFDLSLSYEPPFLSSMGGKISAGIKNISNAYQTDLDKGAGRDPAFLYGPSQPRTLFFGVETSL